MKQDKLEKIIKKLGKDTVAEMEALDESGLKNCIAQAEQSMKQVLEELESNDKFIIAKEAIKALGAGKRDVDARQKAKIQLALQLLSDQGNEPAVAITERS